MTGHGTHFVWCSRKMLGVQNGLTKIERREREEQYEFLKILASNTFTLQYMHCL